MSNVTRIGYLNQGVLLGAPTFTTKAGAKSQKDQTYYDANGKVVDPFEQKNVENPYYVAKSFNDVARFAASNVKCLADIFRRFKNKFRGDPGFTPNWFLPIHLGGLGIDPKYCLKDKVKVTQEQRLLAAHCAQDFGTFSWVRQNSTKPLLKHLAFKKPGSEYVSALYSPERIVENSQSADSLATVVEWIGQNKTATKGIKYIYVKKPRWCAPMSAETLEHYKGYVKVTVPGIVLPSLRPLLIERSVETGSTVVIAQNSRREVARDLQARLDLDRAWQDVTPLVW